MDSLLFFYWFIHSLFIKFDQYYWFFYLKCSDYKMWCYLKLMKAGFSARNLYLLNFDLDLRCWKDLRLNWGIPRIFLILHFCLRSHWKHVGNLNLWRLLMALVMLFSCDCGDFLAHLIAMRVLFTLFNCIAALIHNYLEIDM